jgi:L-lactate dehydrogenase complex protein LldG
MADLVERLRRAVAGGPKREHPGPTPMRDDLPPGELLARFTVALERVAGRVVRVPDEAAAEAFLAKEYSGRSVVRAADRPGERTLAAADVGVDRADLLLADTGTVLKTFPDRAASRASLVPEVSVFLADVDSLVPGYPEAFARLAERHREGRAYSVLITGPSRTADIEKTLVIPAHGPSALTVIVIGV